MGQSARLEETISASVPHIFRRPLLHVSATDAATTVTTFLALGPKIYVDGLVVLDGPKIVGVVGSRHAIEYILHNRQNWSKGLASNIMSASFSMLESDRRLGEALKIFDTTGFAFVPITVGGKVVTTISVRDALRVVVNSKLETSVKNLSSAAITTNLNSSIGSALETMLEANVRNLIVRLDDSMAIINDRMILEYMSSHDGRQTIASAGLQSLYDIKVGTLQPQAVARIDADTPANVAAERLLDINTPCLFLNDESVVTPWDIVMKGLNK